jgi:cytochrome P450
MLSNPPLLEAVKKETDACCTSDGSCDLEKLSSECPHLHAVWYEALRLYNAATTVRKAVQDIHIGGKIIHNCDQIFGPLRNYQLDGKTFGANPLEFNAYRFLEKPNLTRSKKYFPFGGGHTYCPGRYFAEREIYMFIALTLKRFDIQITTLDGVPIENPQAPPVKINVPAPAAMAPTRDIYVTLRERVL